MLNILFCTNCQGEAICQYLKTCEEFNNLFNVDYIENWILLKQTNKNLPKYLNKLKKCDILIYQPLKEKHGKLSTETENGLKTILKQNCKLISFPYIYNSAFWPFFHSGSIDEEFYPGISGRKLANKEVIISLLNRYNKTEILQKYENDIINFNYNENFKKTMLILKENEKNTTIKVSEFILNNYKNKRLFLTKDHPTKFILIYCANEILKILNINYFINELNFTENYHKMQDSSYHTSKNMWPITKQCSEALNLNYYDKDAKHFWKNIFVKIIK